MQDDNDVIYNAVTLLKELNEFHAKFIATIDGLTKIETIAGKFGVNNSEIYTTCLDINLRVQHKIVAVDGSPLIIEYSFVLPRDDNDLIIFNMYLSLNGILHTDYKCENKLCDFNNTYLASIVLNTVTKKLLNSEIFSPSTNG